MLGHNSHVKAKQKRICLIFGKKMWLLLNILNVESIDELILTQGFLLLLQRLRAHFSYVDECWQMQRWQGLCHRSQTLICRKSSCRNGLKKITVVVVCLKMHVVSNTKQGFYIYKTEPLMFRFCTMGFSDLFHQCNVQLIIIWSSYNKG